MNASRLALLAAVLALGQAAPAPAADSGALMTGFSVLVGFPSGSPTGSSGTLLVPGTVIPLDAAPADPAARREAVERRLAFNAALDRLWETFRLDPRRRLEQGAYREARLDQPLELPRPEGAEVALSATLLGYDQRTATFRVVFRQGDKTLADSTVNVERGGRAVVGGMDGAAAPYLFVVVEPDPPGGGPNAVPLAEAAGLSEPRLLQTARPAYPDAARAAGTQGVVVLDVVVDLDGRAADVRVISSPDPLLAEAAMAAVRQWRFEPARTASGEPVKVLYAVTVNFKLQ